MDKNCFRLSLLASLAFFSLQVSARENTGQPQRKDLGGRVDAASCTPASSSIDLNVNNVRARLQNGGDMWWDLVATAHYEVPKVTPPTPPANSLFAGSIWVGGIDENNQLKVAAQTYRQNGNDYFPGPLDGPGGTTTSDICTQFDHQWQVLGTEIDQFRAAFAAANNGATTGFLDPSSIPDNVLTWPGRNNPYNTAVGDRNLAPFVDVNNDDVYDPTTGDYPKIGQGSSNVYADQMIWWVYNDNGNIHTETGGLPIGMEIHALAFAFRSSDQVNDMTFYRYTLINKSSTTLNNCYMGQWVDPDLGNYIDDFIGCDPTSGLGICYNGEPNDPPGGSGGFYGNQPPLVGINYFEGPKDENGNELHMTNFMYYNNDFTVNGNPQKTSDYYGYLSTKWPDGTPLTFGGTGYGGSTPTKFAFPDDPTLPEPSWSECSQHDAFGDRRIIESSGPFKLLPGASNDVVVGIVWVRPPVGYYDPCPSYSLLSQAALKATALFQTNFRILSGPPAPTVRIIEEDKKLILAIEGYANTESYQQADPFALINNIKDSLYRFEGYQIYQLANSTVTNTELTDPTKAQLIFQCDIKNGVTKIINFNYDANVGAIIPQVMVNGADAGIRHTFEITSNAFATTNTSLVNLETYYFQVLPYAYNNYSKNDTTYLYEPKINGTDTTFVKVPQVTVQSQQQPYLPSRIVNTYSGIPHVTQPEFSGLILQSDYGDGPQITRQEGRGNGGLSVNLTPESVIDILNNNFDPTPTYIGGQGPVAIKVYDPKRVPDANFQLLFRDPTLFTYPKRYKYRDTTIKGKATIKLVPYDSLDTSDRDTIVNVNKPNTTILDDTATWTLQMLDGDSVVSEKPISQGVEQPIPDWGLSVYIQQVKNPTGFISTPPGPGSSGNIINWSITYAEPYKSWLAGVPDVDNNGNFNWILSGTYHAATTQFDIQSDWSNGATSNPLYDDPNEQYENIFNRTIAPYHMCCLDQYYAPVWNNPAAHSQNKLDSLPSIDLVFTPDKSKWSRCVVIETGPEINLSEGNVPKMAVRRGRSVDQNGVPSSDPNDLGMGWFPGYAIDPETGMRLDVFFGEDSWQIGSNGRDMIWNPTSSLFDDNGEATFGGRHWIYVTRFKYDGCDTVKKELFTQTNPIPTIPGLNIYKNVAWVEQAMLNPGFAFTPISEGLIPTETTLKIRVTHAYSRFAAAPPENRTFPRYSFNTSNIAAKKEDLATAKTALDTIKIVPNPYYAYAGYEATQVDTRVKIANLPVKCTITIYSLDGTLIRTFNRDDNTSTTIDWDLKNFAGIPIASGMYLVHVDAPGIGEKTLKWFGVLRPIDLDSF